MNLAKPLALAALVAVTAVWGSTFVVVKDAIEQAAPMDFLAVRFLLAAGVLALWHPGRMRMLSRKQWGHGVLLGLLLASAYIWMTIGQQYTSASMSGFITGMHVVFTPVIAALVLRHRFGWPTWTAVAIAITGLAIMTLRGFAIGTGELLTLVGALFFALHVLALSAWSTAEDVYPLTVVQLAVVGVLCLALGAPNGIDLPAGPGFWLSVAGLAVVATAGAFFLQTWAQARLSAAVTAVALALEPVFAGIFGVVVDGDELTARILIGGAMMVGSMALAGWASATPHGRADVPHPPGPEPSHEAVRNAKPEPVGTGRT